MYRLQRKPIKPHWHTRASAFKTAFFPLGFLQSEVLKLTTKQQASQAFVAAPEQIFTVVLKCGTAIYKHSVRYRSNHAIAYISTLNNYQEMNKEDYYNVIKEPMDLEKIRQKIDAKVRSCEIMHTFEHTHSHTFTCNYK